jgi:DUF1680 family protein
MFLLEGEAKYLDVFERIIYNGVLSGLSLSGDRFFLCQSFSLFWPARKNPWFGCACCPPNIARFLPQLGQYVYATSSDSCLSISMQPRSGQMEVNGLRINLEQKTNYPWDGQIRLTVNPGKKAILF